MRRHGWLCTLVGLLLGCAPALVWEGKTPNRQAWVKVVEGPVDPRDPAAVKALLAAGLQEDAGWARLE